MGIRHHAKPTHRGGSSIHGSNRYAMPGGVTDLRMQAARDADRLDCALYHACLDAAVRRGARCVCARDCQRYQGSAK